MFEAKLAQINPSMLFFVIYLSCICESIGSNFSVATLMTSEKVHRWLEIQKLYRKKRDFKTFSKI